MCADGRSWRESGSWRHRASYGSLASGASVGGGVTWKNPNDRRRERLNSELLSAVFLMDVGKVQWLLRGASGEPSVNAHCSETKATTLHIATMRGDEEMLKALLDAGADAKSRDVQGRLALHLAAWEGNIRTTKLLYMADPSLIDAPVSYPTSRWPATNNCGWEHNHNEVSNLINIAKTEEGFTPLHIAAMHCQKSIVDFLLKKGANIKATDALGRTPLDVAGQSAADPEQTTPFSPTTYSTPTIIPQYSGATPYSAAMPVPYSVPMPTTYSTPMDNFVIPADYFQQPRGSVASSTKSVAYKCQGVSAGRTELLPESESQQDGEGKPTPMPSVETADAVPPVGLDGVGTVINTALHDIVTTLMSKGGKFSDSDESETLFNVITMNDPVMMERMLEHGASLSAFNKEGDAPIHSAVRKKKLQPLKVIIQWLSPGQIDMKNKEGLTALHMAVQRQWEEGVGYLLESQASVKEKTDIEGQTVYHMAAMLGNPKLMEELLHVEGWEKVIDELDNDGLTPLFRAVEKPSLAEVKPSSAEVKPSLAEVKPSLAVVEQLVKTAKVDVNVHHPNGSNIIHFAVSDSSTEILKFLVQLRSCHHLINEVTPASAGGMAPIHVAADTGQAEKTLILMKRGASACLHTTHKPLGYVTALHLAAKKGYRRTIETILGYDKTCLQLEDKDGWTALHTACSYGHGKSAVTMIKAGADLSERVNFNGTTKTALDLMVVNVPRSEELLEELMDSYITVLDKNEKERVPQKKNKYLNDPDCKIELNFQILLSSHETCGRQLLFVNSIANTQEPKIRDILLHPLIEIFLHIKWSKMWKFFAVLLLVNFVHTLALTAFCAVIFIQHYNNVLWQTVLQGTFLVTLVPIVVAETLQLMRLERRYWNDYESWIKWTMIFTSGTVGYGSLFAKDIEWIRHFSSFAILSSWIELLFLFSRFRHWGLDVLMFEKVIENVLTVLSKFVFLFLGFMFALMVHFEGAAPFANFWDSFCQVIVMIVELNYGGVFAEESKNANAVIGRLVYVCYMLFVALSMINLTVGLAVSDISDLEKQGRVERLIKRASFLSFLETLAYDKRIIRCFPPRPSKTAQSSFRSVDTVFYVYPNKVGVLPLRLRTALLLKIQQPESLTTQHMDKIITEINFKVDQMSKDIAKLHDSAPKS